MAGGPSGAVAPTPVVPAAPVPPIVDFVCEADVRTAMRDSRKIYIGPKTIVTPSARDVAASSGILVMTAADGDRR